MEQSKHRLTRIGGLAGVMGAILLLVTVGFHPLEADPGDIRAVFREIGADAVWTTIRLDQFVGYLLVFTFFVALHDLIVTTPARWHVRLGVGIGAASLAAADAFRPSKKTPLVSLSSRCTRRGRSLASKVRASSMASRCLVVPLPPWTANPAGLLIASTSSSR